MELKEIDAEILENPDETIRYLQNHPAATQKFHRDRKGWEYMWAKVHGIDKESRNTEQEEIKAANAPTPEQLTERKQLEQSPAHTNRLHKDHNGNMKAWLKTFRPNGSNNGES